MVVVSLTYAQKVRTCIKVQYQPTVMNAAKDECSIKTPASLHREEVQTVSVQSVTEL